MKLVPQEQWTMLSHWLIWHGRRRCFARSPDCPNCEIRHLCPRIGVTSPPPAKASKPARGYSKPKIAA
jgi:endonuclease III